jgi:hypothetical protein
MKSKIMSEKYFNAYYIAGLIGESIAITLPITIFLVFFSTLTQKIPSKSRRLLAVSAIFLWAYILAVGKTQDGHEPTAVLFVVFLCQLIFTFYVGFRLKAGYQYFSRMVSGYVISVSKVSTEKNGRMNKTQIWVIALFATFVVGKMIVPPHYASPAHHTARTHSFTHHFPDGSGHDEEPNEVNVGLFLAEILGGALVAGSAWLISGQLKASLTKRNRSKESQLDD